MQHALTLDVVIPFAGWLEALKRFISLFADDEGGEDKSSESEFTDDLEAEFGEDEGDEDKGDDKEADDKEDKSKKSEKDEESKKDDKPKKSSAVIQKQKYRQKLQNAEKRIKELEDKKNDGSLTEEQRKELNAKNYLRSTLRDLLKEMQAEEEKTKANIEEEFDEEVDAILEENTDVTEKQLLDVCEELEVSPTQALKIIRREEKAKGKPKPKLPQPKGGNPDVDEKDKKETPKTFEEAGRKAKEMLRKGKI